MICDTVYAPPGATCDRCGVALDGEARYLRHDPGLGEFCSPYCAENMAQNDRAGLLPPRPEARW